MKLLLNFNEIYLGYINIDNNTYLYCLIYTDNFFV